MTQKMPEPQAVHAATVLFDLAERAQTDANALRRLGTRALMGDYQLGRLVGMLRKYADAERHGHMAVSELVEFVEQILPENIRKRNARNRAESRERMDQLNSIREAKGVARKDADVLSIRDYR